MSVLKDIKVLDFGHFIAGPFCAALLADYGADVIRVERPKGATDRYIQPLGKEQNSEGGIYLQVNRNKRSLTLDVFSQEGQKVVRQLVKKADVVIANLPDKTLRAMGLSYDILSEINPHIILSTCNAYGPNGESRNWPGFDGVGQAMSGAMNMTGNHGEPRKAYAHYVDYSTAISSAFGIMMALFHRQNTNQGQHVETSLLGTALNIMNAAIIEQSLLQADRQGSGNRAQLAGPADVFRAADGWILLQVLGHGMFSCWAKVIEQEDLIDDPRFANDTLRGENGEALSAYMTQWCQDKTVQQCLDTLRGAGLPVAPVYNFQQALDDPQIAAQGFWQNHLFANIENPYPVANTPVSLSKTGTVSSKSAPLLGQHTNQVLSQFGFSTDQIKSLKQQNII